MEVQLANTEDPNQMPHYVASDLGLHCLPMTLLPDKNGLGENGFSQSLRSLLSQ